MTDFAKLVLDADTKGLKGGERDLRSMSSQSKRTAGDVDRSSSMMARSFGQLKVAATAAAVAGVAALGYFSKTSVQASIDAQEMQSAFDVVFGSMSQSVREWAEATGDAMGRSTFELQRGALAFQELFGKALDTRAAAEMSKQFAVLTQDLASFKNLSNEVAQQKLFSGLVGESEPLRAVGVFLNEAAIQAKALELGLSGVNGKLTDQEKIVARAAVIQEQLAAAQGDVMRTADSTANQIKRAEAAFEELQVTVGNALLPTFTVLINQLGSTIETANNMAATLGITAEGVNTLISVLKTLAVGFVTYKAAVIAATVAQAAMNTQMAIAVGAIATVTRVAGVAAGAKVALTAATAGVTAAFRVLTAAMIANPFGAIAVVVGTLAAAMYGLAESQRAARAETDNLIRSLRGLAQARSADYAARRAEIQLEKQRAQGRIAELEGQGGANYLDAGKRLLGQETSSEELQRLRWDVVRMNGELTASDIAFRKAGEAAKAMNVPVAQAAPTAGAAGTAVGGLSKSLSSAAGSADRFGDSLQSAMDRAYPAVAELRRLNQEITLFDEAARRGIMTQEDAFEAAFRLRQSRRGPANDNIRSANEGPLVDAQEMGRAFQQLERHLDLHADKAENVGVRIARTFKDMADDTIASLNQVANAVRGGGFLDILSAVIGLGLQLGSIGAFGSKVADNINKTPGRANGGAVSAGQSYLVGENRPEIFTPNQNGFITPRAGNDNASAPIVINNSALADVYVDGRVAQAAPATAQAGAQIAQSRFQQSQRRSVRG